MRTKNDTLIKSYILPQTMYLSNEEFGLIVRCLMIQDDYQEQRFKRADDITCKKYIEKENEWLKEFEKRREENPLFEISVANMHGQIQNSHDAFDRLMENYQKKTETARPEKPKYRPPHYEDIEEILQQIIETNDNKELSEFYKFIIDKKINIDEMNSEKWDGVASEFWENQRVKEQE